MARLSIILALFTIGGALAVEFRACTDKNYGGRCETWNLAHGTCTTYAGAATWDNKVSSVIVGPAGQDVKCYIYDGYSCDGAVGGPITPSNPHNDLGAVSWNDRISSFKCFP